MPVPLRRPDGGVVWLPEDQVNHAVARGFTVENAGSIANDLTPVEDSQGGIGGAVTAGLSSVASGATLGLSDVALSSLLSNDDLQALRQARADHSTISTIGNVTGAALPAFFSGGTSAEVSAGELAGEGLGGVKSLMAATPSGQAARLGARIAEGGEGMGIAGRALATVTAGATEGAIQNAGGYVSDVALGDRKLSADGFIGAMGDGALWGGVAGGALSLSSEGLTAARRLFPKAEMTAEAATTARRQATSEMAASLADSDELGALAQRRLTEIADQEAIARPGLKQRLDEIKVKQAQDIANARVRAEELKTASLEQRIAEKSAQRRAKPAMDFLNQFAVPADEGAGVIGSKVGPADDLMSKLQGTKAQLDQGATIAEINAEVAKVNPEAAKINEALVRVKDSKQAMADWLGKYGGDSAVAFDAASPAVRKAKIAAWAKGAGEDDVAAAHFLGDPEGTINGPRLGGESPPEVKKAANAAGAEAAHAEYLAKLPENANTATSGTELMARTQYDARRAAARAQDEVHTAARMGTPKTPTGDEILAAQEPVSSKVQKALKAKAEDFNDDIAKTAPMITQHEVAHADLTDALGQDAPIGAQERTKLVREAQRASEMKATEQTTQLADQLAQKAPSGLFSKVSNAAQVYEALRMMGVPLPNPHDLPVVGPLLSTYLKAKLLGKAFGRFGGKVGATAETTIAEKSAQVRQKVYKAIDAGLAGGAKAAKAAAVFGGGPAAILGHKLFDSGTPAASQPAFTSTPDKGSLGDLYLARVAEVEAAMKPGAIETAVRQRVRTSDPEALQEIIATTTRVLQYVAKEMPQPSQPAGLLESRVWLPSKQALTNWTQCIAAVNDPAGVLARAAVGQASAKEVEAVKNVYPALYADGQQRMAQKVATGAGRDLTTVQRAQLSRTWGLPLDTSSSPETAAWLAQTHSAAMAPPQPTGMQGQPTLAGPVNMGQRTLTRLDSAGG